MLSVTEAAARLRVHPGRVRQLVSEGRLAGEKVGGRWVLSERAVVARAQRDAPPAGRPLSPRAAWGLLFAAAGRSAPWLSEREQRRARQRARAWSLEHWAWGVQHRSVVHRLYGHQSVLNQLADDDRVVRSGPTVRNVAVDLVALDHVEGYVRADELEGLTAEFGLVPSERANVLLRVPPAELFVFGVERDAPWPVVAVDLFDAGDDRSVRAARELFDQERS